MTSPMIEATPVTIVQATAMPRAGPAVADRPMSLARNHELARAKQMTDVFYATAKIALLVCLLALLAIERPGPAFAADFVEWELRRITPSDATSDCIGDPRTPVCAVETFIACTARHLTSLCRQVGLNDWSSFTGTVATLEYAIVYQKRLRTEDIPAHLKNHYSTKPGYIDVQLIERFCRAGQQTCPEEAWWLFSYTVKPVDGGFDIVSWAGEGYPD